MDVVDGGQFFFEKNKQVLAHTMNLSFESFEWQDKLNESRLIRCVNK
jgi:hypothetical protein